MISSAESKIASIRTVCERKAIAAATSTTESMQLIAKDMRSIRFSSCSREDSIFYLSPDACCTYFNLFYHIPAEGSSGGIGLSYEAHVALMI